MPHGVFLRNIQRSTQFLTRRRRGPGPRHFERSGIVRPVAGKRSREKERQSLLSLAWPGLLVTFAGLVTQPLEDLPTASPTSLLFWGLALIATARAVTGSAPLFVRVLAGLIGLGYPVCALLVVTGVLV